MGRRIFEEHNFVVKGRVLPLEAYRLFCDLGNGFQIPEFRRAELIKGAEDALNSEIPQLLASDYMLFCKNGNRSVFEEKYFPRRTMLMDLAIGEHIEKKGRFVAKMIDVLWAILEETTWVLPAHNRYRPADGIGKTSHANMPYSFGGYVDYIDLFSAATGAAVAMAYYFHKDVFDEVSVQINNRIRYELDRQLMQPYLDDQRIRNVCKWSGMLGSKVNNWCPWIVTNILTVCAMTEADMERRVRTVERSMELLDNFAAANPEDGGCDEGPRYWELAGGSLWAACALLHDMTGGKICVLTDPLLVNMGEYELKMIVAPNHLLNFADASRQYVPNPYLLYHWGITSGSKALEECAGWLMQACPRPFLTEYRTPFKYLRYLTTPRLPAGKCCTNGNSYIESLQIAVTRPSGVIGEGLYLAVKGGHNGESHNHNDLGQIVVYSDDQPVFVDIGAGEYTKRYFSPERYDVWHTRSDFHNCATINGVTQRSGKDFSTEAVVYDPQTGKLTMSLRKAYPEEAGIQTYIRSAVLTDRITVTDTVALAVPGTVQLHFMTVAKPEPVTENSFCIMGKNVEFDPLLRMTVDEPDLTIPEADPLPGFWGVEKFYRITLTTKEKIKEHTFVTTVK